ncbi:protein toll [Caerostris extrusa]|uniref:Protein toll n=1 Tax=Caerostris extrusa TaxID=172846 RepID=A0AAV4NRE1_CAEEX|nr:protein toll [Caerostris extrusa]
MLSNWRKSCWEPVVVAMTTEAVAGTGGLTFLTSGLSGLTIQNSFCEESADIPGGAQPTRPAIAQVPLILQQFHRIRRAGRISGHGGSDVLRHLLQPSDVSPPDLFKPWTKLDTVVLSHNQLLHVDQLFLRTNPRVIFLGHNNLTDLDAVLHPGMYNVDQLDLSHNPIPRVTENSFNGKVNNTRYIKLDNCLIQEFNVRHYIGLRLLRLELNYNLIDKIINLYEANYTDDYIKEFNGKPIYFMKYC